MGKKNEIGCEIWSADGDFTEKFLPLGSESLRDIASSLGADDSATMVWNDGEDPCLMIALSEGRAVVTLILEARFHTLIGSNDPGDMEIMVGGQSVVQPKRLTTSVGKAIDLIGDVPRVDEILHRYSWYTEE